MYVSNRLREARPTFGSVTKESGVGLGCIAIRKNSVGWYPWTASFPPGGLRMLDSPHLQGPIKASNFAVIVVSSDQNVDDRRKPTGYADVK